MKFTKRNVGLVVAALVVLFLVAQIPPLLVETNPPVTAQPQWDSAQTLALAKRACFDCHSNETTWPWYSRVAPSSYLIAFDVVRGRSHFNFSEWNKPQGEGRGGNPMQEAAQQVQRGAMPPGNYLTLHPDAALTDAEKQQLIQGLRASK